MDVGIQDERTSGIGADWGKIEELM